MARWADRNFSRPGTFITAIELNSIQDRPRISELMKARARTARPRLDVDERREQLLHLGLELFGKRSYESISIDDIAKAAGISRSLLYHYFRNKRGFYVETIRRAADKLREAIEPDSSDPPHERLRRGLNAYLDYVARFARAYATLLRSGVGFDPEVSAIVERTRTAIIGDIITNLGGHADQQMVHIALRGWLGMVEAASLEWLERRRVSKPQLIAMLSDALEAALDRALGVPVARLLEAAPGEQTPTGS
jgi:AcrR family transcriptional regulator